MLKNDSMIKVLDQVQRIRKYVDPNFAGRDWNLATAMGAIQIMEVYIANFGRRR